MKLLNNIKRPLTNFDILKFGKYLPHFRGVFMRNKLPKRCRKYECGVVNLDDAEGPGTHWVSYHKKDNECYYFDSFGDLQPFKEFIAYVGKNCMIHFNYKQQQTFNTVVCGQLCLQFLFQMLYI